MAQAEGRAFADMMLIFHDLSMSNDPELAVRGRCAKAIISAVERWIDDEVERGSLPSLRVIALSRVFTGALGMLTLLYARSGYEADALQWAEKQLREDMESAVEATIETLRLKGRAAQ